jgi:hypothetical protein
MHCLDPALSEGRKDLRPPSQQQDYKFPPAQKSQSRCGDKPEMTIPVSVLHRSQLDGAVSTDACDLEGVVEDDCFAMRTR